jgi:hypothetical protein
MQACYDLPKLCHEPVPESAEDLYWALGEVICYVAGASLLLTNGHPMARAIPYAPRRTRW